MERIINKPVILIGISLLLLSNPSLAIVLLSDYLFLDPIIKYLTSAISPKFKLPKGNITMHIVLLTYVLWEYLRGLKGAKPSVGGFVGTIEDNKMKLILLLVIILTISSLWNIRKDEHTATEIAVAIILGLLIGAVYISLTN